VVHVHRPLRGGVLPDRPCLRSRDVPGLVHVLPSTHLVFEAPNGDKLALAANWSSTTAPSATLADGGTVDGTWTVDPTQTTGRYAHFTGSGTYRLSGTVQETNESFSLGLSGSLTSS
jgi:hypothetical protein